MPDCALASEVTGTPSLYNYVFFLENLLFSLKTCYFPWKCARGCSKIKETIMGTGHQPKIFSKKINILFRKTNLATSWTVRVPPRAGSWSGNAILPVLRFSLILGHFPWFWCTLLGNDRFKIKETLMGTDRTIDLFPRNELAAPARPVSGPYRAVAWFQK